MPKIKDEQMEEHCDEEEDEMGEKPVVTKKVYVPGLSRGLKKNEELVYDSKAYLLCNKFETNYPCLSFDILQDQLGNNRRNFPMTAWIVTGTQADRPKNNELLVMRLSNMRANKKAFKAQKQLGREEDEEEESSSSSSSEEESSEDDEEEEKVKRAPKMHASRIAHYGGVNRLKCTRIGSADVCAVWNDQKKVQLWDLSPLVADVSRISPKQPSKWNDLSCKPLFDYKGHFDEGFALAWSPVKTGALASGDVQNKIFLWKMSEAGQWLIDQRPLSDHTGSIEDLAWSPTEEAMLLSCSSDCSIRLWDVRLPPKQACVSVVTGAHEADVNVLSWNQSEPLVVSGGDDGLLRVWAMKSIQYGQPVAQFKHHKKPITSVDWSPHDSTVFMASSEDDQTTIWDLALEEEEPTAAEEQGDEIMAEADDEARRGTAEQLPPQLLFIHMGQNEVKEVHWHKQCPGLAFTTSLDGFHVFKTINV